MKAVAEELAGIDIASPEVYAKGIPHEGFALLRERDPVHWHPWAGSRRLLGGDEVRRRVTVAKDRETFSSAVGHIYLWDLEEEALEVRRSMIETDPPEHSRLRRIVCSAFTPRKVREYERPTRQITTGCSMLRCMGEVDLVEPSPRRSRSTSSSRSSASPTTTRP